MSSKHPSRTHTQSAHTRPLLSEVSKVTIIPFSLLWWTNETLNIWSHIAGFVVFFGLFLYDVNVVYYKYQATENDAVVASFVLLCFMTCMILSSLYHTLNCRSEESCRKWLSYDIFGISASFFAIFLSGIYYGFWCPEEWEWARVTLFTGWAVSGLLPTIHWTLLHGGVSTGIVQVFLPRILMMYAISGTAVVVYVWKIPERYFPGRFDFIGSSHQLWHLIIVAALVYWHQTGLEYAYYRMVFGCSGISAKE
ncbi:putative progestin and adipoQ receptor family member 3 isoform X1 [Penaeus vannamei]|uniref:Putative progestin and adipoQ receptor family member 3 isoform X1 n=1 Tax=Penaeus vannamei TaxID=6689 RepID=A0A3R7N2F7_PENVA|nr:putative progestin and adipoQ receptor family member 3 isoform X1 [Penaeus vannamei]